MLKRHVLEAIFLSQFFLKIAPKNHGQRRIESIHDHENTINEPKIIPKYIKNDLLY
jgi:hypothetical protein